MSTLTPTAAPWSVPFGFSTYELTGNVEGPVRSENGRAEYGQVPYHYGVQHIYDDGTVRIVVRPGGRDSYTAAGYCVLIESVTGDSTSQVFPNVHAALSAAGEELCRWPQHRRALSAAAGSRQ